MFNFLKKHIYKFAILFIILSSLFFRWDNIFAYRAMTYEWNYATVLTHLEIWNEKGASGYFFNPVVTRPNGANKFIDNNASNEEGRMVYGDKEGNFYYTSYPQFAYIAPYLFFKIFSIQFDVVSLRIFNVLVQILTALIIFRLLFELTKKKIIAIIGLTTYIYLPVSFVFYVDNYMSDMLVNLFFVFNLYFLTRIVRDANYKKLNISFFVIGMFLMVYTDWFGICFAGIVFLFAILNRKKSFARVLLWTSVLCPTLAVGFSVFQYSLSASLESFLIVMVDRYSGSYGSYSLFQIEPYKKIISFYFYWYKAFLYLTGIFLFIIILDFFRTNKFKFYFSNKKITLILLSLLPVLVHHIIFLNWTVFHAKTFSTLKLAVFFAFLTALLFEYLLYNLITYRKKVFTIGIFISFFVVLNMTLDAFNRYELRGVPELESSFSNCNAGEFIGLNSNIDEVIFIKDLKKDIHHFPIKPSIPFCAKRNIEIFAGYNKAFEIMKKNNTTKGVIFTITYLSGNSAYVIKKENFNLQDKIKNISL